MPRSARARSAEPQRRPRPASERTSLNSELVRTPVQADNHVLNHSSATYVNQVSNSVHEQQGGVCYAYAMATSLRAAESRIYGRQLQEHGQMVEEIIKMHGRPEGPTVDEIKGLLKRQCAKRRLRFTECTGEEAAKALEKDHVIISAFFLTDDEWKKFQAFFKEKPSMVLEECDIKADQKDRRGGHAVTLVGDGGADNYWKIKNSWGKKFADAGYFRVDKQAIVFNFYHVFFVEGDLSETDRMNYQKLPTNLTLDVDEAPEVCDGALMTGFDARHCLDMIFVSKQTSKVFATPSPAHPIGQGATKRAYLMQHRNSGGLFVLKLACGETKSLTTDFAESKYAAQVASIYRTEGAGGIRFCLPIRVTIIDAFTASNDSVPSWKGKQALLEVYLSGRYEKFVCEKHSRPHKNPQAFFHFSFYHSTQEKLIWDLQGVYAQGEYRLTDPFVVSSEMPHPEFGNPAKTFEALYVDCSGTCGHLKDEQQHLTDEQLQQPHGQVHCQKDFAVWTKRSFEGESVHVESPGAEEDWITIQCVRGKPLVRVEGEWKMTDDPFNLCTWLEYALWMQGTFDTNSSRRASIQLRAETPDGLLVGYQAQVRASQCEQLRSIIQQPWDGMRSAYRQPQNHGGKNAPILKWGDKDNVQPRYVADSAADETPRINLPHFDFCWCPDDGDDSSHQSAEDSGHQGSLKEDGPHQGAEAFGKQCLQKTVGRRSRCLTFLSSCCCRRARPDLKLD